METLIFNGNTKLSGEVTISGCKNSALPILISCLTVKGKVCLYNLPSIGDVYLCIDILRYFGASISFEDKTTVTIDTSAAEYRPLPAALTKKLRASSYLLGAMLSRFGKCELPLSGGCDIGTRPLDYHIRALRSLGASFREDTRMLTADNGIRGGYVIFPTKTVGGTVNAIVASAVSKGTTKIINAAREPHVCDLCDFLRKCGANVSGDGSDVITVIGVERLHGCTHSIDHDMIEAGTYMIASLATGGKIRCKFAPSKQLISFFEVLKNIGADVFTETSGVTVTADRLKATDVMTCPYPGLPTDLQPQLTALLGISEGISSVTDTVFEARFRYLQELEKFGLEYECLDNTVKIKGIQSYLAANVNATDLRGGAACIIAALNAKGKSVINNANIIKRGYSDIESKLRMLGADVTLC